MAYTTIDDGSEYFTTTLYTGNGSSIDVTNSANSGNFAPDWLWIKERSATSSHIIFDTNRPVSGGFAKHLHANETAAESGDSSELTAFGSNGFSYGSDGKGNQSSQTYVAWQWKANGGTTTTNDASATSVGTIDSVYQANTTAGFSIVTYTGTGSNGTIAHGLGVTPKVVLIKNRDRSESWRWGDTINESGFGKQLLLNDTDAIATDNNTFNDTNPTSTVFSVGTRNATNANTEKHVAYCFAEKQGYSKFGSYTGNGDADGAFVYTGFKPSWLMVKNTESARNWMLFDNKRGAINVIDEILEANTTDAERDGDKVDFLSNGFKMRDNGSENNSSEEFIYLAFAEHPFVSSKGVPVTAR